MNKNEKYEEKDLVESTVDFLNIKHKILDVGEGNLLDDLNKAIEGYSGPLLNSNYLEHWKLMQLIKNDGYKVSVSGTGADELFSGYYDHFLYYLSDLYLSGEMERFNKEKSIWEDKILPLTRNSGLQSIEKFLNKLNCRDYIFDNRFLVNKYLKYHSHKKVFDFFYCDQQLRNRMANELLHESVPAILYQDDSNSMHSSIENRSPFLDSDLFKWSLKIPSKFFIKNGYAKSILRDSMHGIADPKICKSRKKVGFNVPIDDLIKLQDKKLIIESLKKSFLGDIVKIEDFKNLLNKKNKNNQESKFIFSIFSVNAFLDNFSF